MRKISSVGTVVSAAAPVEMTRSPELNRLLDSREVARVLGVSPHTLKIWRFTKRYPLRYIKVGGQIRYRETDVNKFLESQSVAPGFPAPKRRRRARA